MSTDQWYAAAALDRATRRNGAAAALFSWTGAAAQREEIMSKRPIEYADAPPEVRAVFDDIKRTRGVPDVNNFWKHLAHDPAGLKRTWESLKQVMAPGALDPLTKELIYLAV